MLFNFQKLIKKIKSGTDKWLLLTDSLFQSIASFFITFILLHSSGSDGVYGYGISVTIALLAMSLFRNSITVPYNATQGQGGSKNTNLFLSDCVASYALLTIAVCLFSLIYYSYTILLLSVSIFSFLCFNETLRVSLLGNSRLWIPGLISLSYLSVISLFGFFNLLNLLSLCIIYSTLSAIQITALANVAAIPWRSFSLKPLWSKRDSLLGGCGVSLSQLTLVHLPIIVASGIYTSGDIAKIFIARSIFQGIQICIKSMENVDQRKLLSDKNEGMRSFKSLSIKYVFYSTLIGLPCGIFFYTYGAIIFPSRPLPAGSDLFFWLGIFTVMSAMRVSEMFFYREKKLSAIVISYFCGGITSSAFIFFNFNGSASAYIFAGWLLTAITMMIFFIKAHNSSPIR